MTLRVAQMLDTLYWGGAQRMQMFLIETLMPLGIEITVIDLGDSSESNVPAMLKEMGVRVVAFPFDVLFSPAVFLRLVGFLRAEKFDLLHTYLTYANILGPLAGMLSGTPVITSLRNADFEFKNYSRKRELLERLTMRFLSQRTMANGHVVGEFARKRLGANAVIDIIPNAIEPLAQMADTERLALRCQLLGDPSRIMILSVGRLTEQKGFPDLIQAFASIHADHPEATLVIAGDGDDEDALRAQIGQLGLQDFVSLLGMRDDARQLMAAADIYVNSSLWEGTPVTVLEAMATGLPVIATRVGENPYLLDEGAGLLVSARQPAELAQALKSLLSAADERQRLAQAALGRVRAHYSRAVWQKSLLELYAKVTPKAGEYLTASRPG